MLFLLGCSGASVAPLTREEAQDPASCQSCHPAHYDQWSRSMHAYADIDPIFRAMNAMGQRETGGGLGTFCLGCHAPVAVREGATEDGSNLDDLPPGQRGITCWFCHTLDEIVDDHNAGVWGSDDVLRAGIEDPFETGAHASEHGAMQDRDELESAAMCGACHDVVTNTGLHLERGYEEWLVTQYATDTPGLRQTCGNCHMDGRDGRAVDDPEAPMRRLHDHSFPAVDTALVDFPGRDELAADVQQALDPVVLSALTVCTGAKGVEARLVLENVAAGHGFPSGAAQHRRAWVEIEASVGDTTLLHVGDLDADTPVPLDDPELWAFGDQLYDADGAPVHLAWEGYTNVASQLQGLTEGVDVHARRTWILSEAPDTVTARIHLRPFDVDILQTLVDSGDLDATVADAVPTWTLAGSEVSWTGPLGPCLD